MPKLDQRFKFAVDAHGGDHGLDVILNGIHGFLKESPHEVILAGNRDELERKLGPKHDRITVVHAPDKIEMKEKASNQLRHRSESSMYQCIDLVARKEADACLSAGSSASFMALSLLLLKRLEEVERPALVTPIPTLKNHPCLALDMGANVDCKPSHLVHFALMGHAYAQITSQRGKPRIGLISNGEEDTKGNDLTRETHQILKSLGHINYGGYCEGRDIFSGDWDVVICDGFVGNVILKTAEGLAETLMTFLKQSFTASLVNKIGYLLVKSSLKPLKKKLDYAEYGGAPLLGVNGVSVVCHGRSNATAIKNALHTAQQAVEDHLLSKMTKALSVSNTVIEPREAQP